MSTKTMRKERTIIVISAIIFFVVVAVMAMIMGGNKGKNADIAQTDANGQEEPKEEYVTKLEDGSKLNTSEELQKNKKLDGLELSNIQLKETGGITTLLADVKNNTRNNIEEKMVVIDVLDKTGAKITEIKGIIDRVAPGETVQLNVSVTADIANAYDFKISNN